MTDQNTTRKDKSLFSLLTATALFVLMMFFHISLALPHTGGQFIYPVDDAYIHMQIAKNLAFHGTWGINAGEFSSASSSILYTLILAGTFAIAGDHVLVPLMINCVAAIILLVVTWQWLRRHLAGWKMQSIVLCLLVILTPLPLLVMTGMEHTLQCLFSFLFLYSFAGWIQDLHNNGKQLPGISLLIYAVLCATIRYEGLFLVGMACLALLYYRKAVPALVLGAVAAVPLVIFGIYSVAHDSYFLPNSVLVKSEAAQFSLKGVVKALGMIVSERLTFSKSGIALLTVQRLLIILPLLFLVFLQPLKAFRSYRFLLLAVTGASLLQVSLADTGKFYRYEAYLVYAAALIALVILVKFWKAYVHDRYRSLQLLVYLLGVFLLLPVILRAITANAKVSRASINIYEQQYQMSRFLGKYYEGKGVAANDIGAIAFFTGSRIIDLWGLGDIDMARSKKGGYWNAAFLDSSSRKKGGEIAIVYDSWIDRSLPPGWKKAGEWKIYNNVVCGDDHVSFYAIDSTALPALKNNLVQFQSALPSTVSVTYQTNAADE